MKSNPFKFLQLSLVLLTISSVSAQKKVVLDNYYNCETNAKTNQPFHYLWDDKAFSGFSELGEIFTQQGAVLASLKENPTCKNLKGVDIYIIVDPDHEKDAKAPNFMDKKAAAAIASWVKAGGVLLLLTNDSSNCELAKFNLLPSKFGITFNIDFNHPELRGADKKVRNFQSCASENLPNHSVFEGVNKIFIKEIASLNCKKPAKPILVENGKTYMAESTYGKGYVFAVGDPWLYNEYIDHALLPADFHNKQAAENLVKLLMGK
jgi:unsaturated rhamnogalacturonyl hydrolase